MRVAVIGSGISGLAAAWLLDRKHDVHLFERRQRLGGHSHTVVHDENRTEIPLDTGFLVYNEATYPNLTRLFAELDVATQDSDMSFAVSCADPDVEYASHGLRGFFAQGSNLLRLDHWRLLADIARFGRRGRSLLATDRDPTCTVEQFLEHGGFGDRLARLYLQPMVAAIWSSGTQTVRSFPRDALLHFLDNHGLLRLKGQPQWRTVTGGSRRYVERMVAPLEGRVHVGAGITQVRRSAADVRIELADGSSETFDHVVIAAHADQALGMLADPSDRERELLGAWQYSRNETWLHTDTTLMPRRRRAWASWNYLLDSPDADDTEVSVSYHLNRLQRPPTDTDYIVTLNPKRPPAADSVVRQMTYFHPVYTTESVATQSELPGLNGTNRTHFCGAYFRYGFHEDGLVSAIRVAEDLGVTF
jgi:predicted NAD/FAD-binding protein